MFFSSKNYFYYLILIPGLSLLGLLTLNPIFVTDSVKNAQRLIKEIKELSNYTSIKNLSQEMVRHLQELNKII